MATAEELRQEITANRRKLRDALGAAGEKWESADDDGWSPRHTAEHCIGREFGLAGIGAAAMRGDAAEWQHARTNHPGEASGFSFATAAEALAALESTAADCDAAFGAVEDDDLVKSAELDVDSLPNTIEGVMRLTAWHLNDHAEQIAKM